MNASRRVDGLLILLLLLLPLLWFAPQALGSRTLLPADNLFAFEPWKHFASELGVGVPHNALISDLILENHPWKSFIVEALRAGRPADALWSPRLFAGSPFIAAGQQSALYPLSLLFYLLPLWRAFGVFTWLQIGLAGAAMYVFARVLRLRPLAALLAGVAFAFSGFFIVSVNFTMIIAAAAWLPLILAVVEVVVRKQEEKGAVPFSPVPYIAAGAALIGLQAMAGHVEITYYILMVTAFYAAWRLAALRYRLGHWRPVLRLAAWLAVMVALGLAIAAAQLVPLYELVTQSFREKSATLAQVREWAWPSRQILTFLLPDFFGNPTHHAYFDIWQRTWVPVTRNANGQPLDTIFWGIKNYVEGGNYLGLGTLLLAASAAVAAVRQAVRQAVRRSRARLGAGPLPFVVLAVGSLLLAFGTPLYALLYYGLPGYSQLHSAFRWVFPYTLAMAALAAYGLDALLRWREERAAAEDAYPLAVRLARTLGGLAALAGAGALVVVAASMVVPAPFIALGERLLAFASQARDFAFADGAMAWSYEATGLARFGAMAFLTGGALWLATRRSSGTGARGRIWPVALVALLLLDLWLVGHHFNPATDPKLLDFKPPVLTWLQERLDPVDPWRFTTFDEPGEKLLNANAAMPYGLEDVRGYDSIILKQYAGYASRIQPQDGDLLYNRIGPLVTQWGGQPNYDRLDNPLLDLLGVRYVVSTHHIPNAGYSQVYDGEVKVFENAGAFPRAFLVGEAVSAPDQAAALDRLATVDPANAVVIEGLAPDAVARPASPALRDARISRRTNREVFIDVNLSDRGWLVLTDSFFEGWKAYVRPFGAEGEGVSASGESVEQQLPIYRADGIFRAVYLPQAGQWTVRFVYSPRSFLLGLYVTFLGGITLLLLGGAWAWGRFYRGSRSEMGTVAKNSVVQMAMSLLSKGIDFAFAMLRLRVLSPAGEGSYAFAISFYGVFEIITRFGLGTLVTRDVALEKGRTRAYLANVISLRLLLWALSLPLMGLMALFYRVSLKQLTGDELRAIGLFAAALLFANIADAVTAIFNAYEKMEYPAGTATAIAVGKVALSALVLLPPLDLGFVGLAGVSVVMNLAQVVWLYALLRTKVLPGAAWDEQAVARPTAAVGGAMAAIRRARGLDWGLQRHMLRESGPLMINHLLATIFWRISQFVLRGATNPASLGIFSAGVKYLDGLNVIPAYFTLAIFPLMSRYARGTGESLLRAYRLALQLLVMAALPIAVFFTFAATPLIQILGGAAYLPDSAIALRIMIWSIPIGFANSVTQYVLIAVNQQRFLTRAFLFGVAFTAVANLLLVPRFGFIAAAAILIPAELALFIPFAGAVRRHVGPMPWFSLLSRPLAAAAADAAVTWAATKAGLPLPVALVAGGLTYVAGLLVLRCFRGEEFDALRGLIRRRR